MTNENDPHLRYSRRSARYAKGKVALHVPGSGGWKSLADMILTNEIAPNARYSRRENSYIVSPLQADRFELAVEESRIKREKIREDKMNCIPEDDAHIEECIKGTDRCDDFYSHETEGNYASIGNATPDYADTMPHNQPPYETSPKPEPVTTSHTFIVDVKEFRAAMEMGVCGKKTTIPVLQTVALQPHGSSLQVVSTDLDKWTLTDVPAMIDDEAGSVLLPHRKTLELLKGETGILKITAKVTTLDNKFLSAWVKLEVGGCEYDLPSMNPANFPALPVVPAVEFDVSGADLKASIGRVIGCISTEESRYTLNGALLEFIKDKLLLVATDGYRLALDGIWVEGVRKGKALIPRDSLAWLYKYSAGEMVITFGEDQSFFHVGTTIFVTRNVKGNFPNWQAVTPRKDSFTLTASFASGDDLAKPLAKVARMADERSGTVKFRINGHCVLSAESCDTGKASATVKASIKHSESGAEIVAGFNSGYVLDVLKVAGKSPIVLSMKDSRHAGVFTVPSLPEYSYTLMPIRG